MYLELADLITGRVDEVEWLDLWSDQITYLDEQYAFPFPAVFLSFRTESMATLPDDIQTIDAYLELTVASHTLADSYEGSFNQETALAFMELLNALHVQLQGTSGNNFSALDRVGMVPVETGGNIIVYRMTYRMQLQDYSAQAYRLSQQGTVTDPDLKVEEPPANPPAGDEPLFEI